MFSEREEKIIKIIGESRVSISHVTKELFKNEEMPFDARIIVGNAIIRIAKKCEHYKLDWTLFKNRNNAKLTVSKISAYKTFTVRKRVDSRGYSTFRYSHAGDYWTQGEIEAQPKIHLNFNEKMSKQDIEMLLSKWAHKLIL